MDIIYPISLFFSPGIGGGLLTYLVLTFCLYRIAKKLGRNDAWNAFIPFLNILYLCQISEVDWGCLLLIVPILNLFVYMMIWIELCKKLKQPEILGVLTIFPPFSIVTTVWLAFID